MIHVSVASGGKLERGTSDALLPNFPSPICDSALAYHAKNCNNALTFGMKRLVYYSLSASRVSPRPDLVWQIELSVRSLRAYNRTVPVIVFTYGDVPEELAPALAPYGVSFCHKGSYQAALARLSPHGWQILSQYPLLHKFLNFPEIAAQEPDQVLFLDCDTLFFQDVDSLFSHYSHADCYAREEPTCRRSHYGYNPTYVDEDSLAKLGETEGVRTAPPFNLGVVSLNNGLWHHLARLETVFLSYAWRFAVWMAMNPVQGQAVGYGEGQGIVYLRQYFDQLAGEDDVERALPYPSANRWILDQVALWLTLGHVPDLRYGDYSVRDVLQNGEILSRSPQERDWVLCHYFSQNRERLVHWLNQPQVGNRENGGAATSIVQPTEIEVI